MIELPHEPRFARIYKTWYEGVFNFQAFSAKTQEEYESSVKHIEVSPSFRGWVSEVEDADVIMDYNFDLKIRAFRTAEENRIKTPLEQLEVQLYQTRRELEAAKLSLDKLCRAHDVSITLLQQLKTDEA